LFCECDLLSFSPQSSGTHKPNPVVVPPVPRVVVVPVGRPGVVRVVVPRPAAYHAAGTIVTVPLYYIILF